MNKICLFVLIFIPTLALLIVEVATVTYVLWTFFNLTDRTLITAVIISGVFDFIAGVACWFAGSRLIRRVIQYYGKKKNITIVKHLYNLLCAIYGHSHCDVVPFNMYNEIDIGLVCERKIFRRVQNDTDAFLDFVSNTNHLVSLLNAIVDITICTRDHQISNAIIQKLIERGITTEQLLCTIFSAENNYHYYRGYEACAFVKILIQNGMPIENITENIIIQYSNAKNIAALKLFIDLDIDITFSDHIIFWKAIGDSNIELAKYIRNKYASDNIYHFEINANNQIINAGVNNGAKLKSARSGDARVL